MCRRLIQRPHIGSRPTHRPTIYDVAGSLRRQEPSQEASGGIGQSQVWKGLHF
jgi:hypothetical protein